MPSRSGSRPLRSRTSRATRSIRSSRWSALRGAPAVSMILPPSRLMSLSKNVTSWSAQACCTVRTSSSRASARALGPSWARRSSDPAYCTNATVIARCSASPAPPSRWARTGGDSGLGRLDARVRRRARDRRPGSRPRGAAPGAADRASRGSPSVRAGSSAAVAALSPICPAAEAASSRAVTLTPGPLTTSSRWRAGSPTRKKSKSPLWTPTDIRSTTAPDDVGIRPTRRSVDRIRWEARAARGACPSPWKSRSTASPPHLTRSAPSATASASSAAKVASRMSLISSAPTLPRRLSRSVSWVNPEMSTNASEPATRMWRGSGPVGDHVRSSLGAYGSSRESSSRCSCTRVFPRRTGRVPMLTGTMRQTAVMRLPDPALVVLVGASGSGKSTWAAGALPGAGGGVVRRAAGGGRAAGRTTSTRPPTRSGCSTRSSARGSAAG